MYAIVIVLEILYVECLYKEINVFLLFFFFVLYFFFHVIFAAIVKKFLFSKFFLLAAFVYREDIYFYEGLDHNFVCVFCSETFC